MVICCYDNIDRTIRQRIMNNRIDRIDGNKYYEYTKIKNLNVSDAEEKFSLDYKQDELQTGAKEKKDEDKAVAESEAKKEKESGGVRLEISNSGRAASASRPRTASPAKSQTQNTAFSIISSIRDVISTAIAAVKDFFYQVWNDSAPADANQDNQGAQGIGLTGTEKTIGNTGIPEIGDSAISVEADVLAGGAESIAPVQGETPVEPAEDAESQKAAQQRLDRAIQPYLRSGDLNQVISLLTDNGRKTAARNSTLLTYYDRNGRMTEPSASDRERILYGDRNTRKL